MAAPTTHITISEAAARLRLGRRRIKQLIDEGQLKAVKIEPGEHRDKRVRTVISVRSLNHLKRQRESGKKRSWRNRAR